MSYARTEIEKTLLSSMKDMVEMQEKQLQKLSKRINDLECNNASEYRILSREEVEQIAFSPTTSERVSKRFSKLLIKAEKLKRSGAEAVTFLEYDSGKVVVREY